MTQSDGVTLVKEHISIVEVVGRYTQLQRRGQRLAGRCPLHNEKTPSFYVDDTKGLFHCFGCQKGGDLIQFIMDVEGMEFIDALEFLADLAGVELPRYKGSGPGRDVIEGLRTIYNEAVAFYQQNLRRAKPAKDYLQQRGLKDSTVQLFKLGWAPAQWDALFLHLKDKHPAELLMQSGLFKEGKSGQPFDLFRERVIFPIYDSHARPIALGGRDIAGEGGPKYINSPETPLYTKGKHLYNLQFAKNILKKHPEVVVCEGYMDVIQVYQAGVGNVIACLGTAFTPEQAKLLKRHTDKVILNFDPDAAGFKAARASIETFLKIDMEARVVTLPDKLDPDDFIRQEGVDAYREAVTHADNFFDYLMQYLSADKDLVENPRERSLVAQEMCETLRVVRDPVVREHYLEKLSSELGLGDHILRQILAKLDGDKPMAVRERDKVVARQARRVANDTSPFNRLEAEFLFYSMHVPNVSSFLPEDQRENLPRILEFLFQDRPWLLRFLGTDGDVETRLQHVPADVRPFLRATYFSEAFDAEDTTRLEILFPDLLRQMLQNLEQKNKRRIKALPPEDEDGKRQLMLQNFQLKRQYHQL